MSTKKRCFGVNTGSPRKGGDKEYLIGRRIDGEHTTREGGVQADNRHDLALLQGGIDWTTIMRVAK